MYRKPSNGNHVVCLIAVIYCACYSPITLSTQYSLRSNVTTQAGYNDNIFVTTLPHSSVSYFNVAPSIRLKLKDKSWDAYMNGKVRSNKYSDNNYDSNDAFLDISSNYYQERNIYILSGNYNKDSNLGLESTNFGITGNRVKRTVWSIMPQYQRLLTERLTFIVSFNRSAAIYVDPGRTGAVSYTANTLSNTLQYDLTERNKLSLTQQTTTYASKNNSFKYRMSVLSTGLEHQFTELWSINVSIGTSKRNSTSTSTIPFNFFGQQVFYTQVIDFSNDGKVFNFDLSKQLETGLFTTSISRNDVTSSYGGLNEVNSLKLLLKRNITELWRYNITAQYEKIKSTASSLSATNYKTQYIDQMLSYTIDRHWRANASYRYLQRKFTGSFINGSPPHSNTIYFSVTYNFPDISTY